MDTEFQEQQDRYSRLLEKQLEEQRLKALQSQNEYSQISSFSGGGEQNLIEYELDLKDILDRIHHLLSGHTLKIDERSGNEIWVEPKDDRLKIFSEHGVKQIMNIISFYINRNTLLAYYSEPMIKWKVRDFGIELADLIFMRYEVFFHFPSPEELFELHREIMWEQGIKISEEELYFKCVEWSREELQNKIRHYPMISMAVIDSVHSTFLRALNGQTHKGLRTRTHITEDASRGQNLQQPQKKSFNIARPSTWRGA